MGWAQPQAPSSFMLARGRVGVANSPVLAHCSARGLVLANCTGEPAYLCRPRRQRIRSMWLRPRTCPVHVRDAKDDHASFQKWKIAGLSWIELLTPRHRVLAFRPIGRRFIHTALRTCSQRTLRLRRPRRGDIGDAGGIHFLRRLDAHHHSRGVAPIVGVRTRRVRPAAHPRTVSYTHLTLPTICSV